MLKAILSGGTRNLRGICRGLRQKAGIGEVTNERSGRSWMRMIKLQLIWSVGDGSRLSQFIDRCQWHRRIRPSLVNVMIASPPIIRRYRGSDSMIHAVLVQHSIRNGGGWQNGAASRVVDGVDVTAGL